ncbi:unnamed protein product [Symbiodinium sp. CCMP2592]|nr:unnamed protein product [Symbiodinium sp. CCMP2592]
MVARSLSPVSQSVRAIAGQGAPGVATVRSIASCRVRMVGTGVRSVCNLTPAKGAIWLQESISSRLDDCRVELLKEQSQRETVHDDCGREVGEEVQRLQALLEKQTAAPDAIVSEQSDPLRPRMVFTRQLRFEAEGMMLRMVEDTSELWDAEIAVTSTAMVHGASYLHPPWQAGGTSPEGDGVDPRNIQPAVYVVLRSRLGRPARFTSFTALRRAIGEIEGSDSVLHSFGSIAEAKVYCYGDSHGLPCRLKWPLICNGTRDLQVLCLPLLQRPGGFMVCVPAFLHTSALGNAASTEPLDSIGPFCLESVETIDEDESGEEHPTGIQCQVLLVDLDESLLSSMEPFDPVTDLTVSAFVEDADLLQLSGTGSWDPTPFLSDELWLAYVEPKSASRTNRLRPLIPASEVVDLPAWKVWGKGPVTDRMPEPIPPCHDGLIIDDYFSISKVPRAEHDRLEAASPTAARDRLQTAREVYLRHSLQGSANKDIENAKVASIAGAEVDSRTATLDKQLCVVGAPRSKRLALSDLTLEICSLPATSDALHACIMGSRSSVFTFRRPCFCAFSAAFGLVPLSQLDPLRPRVLPLPRRCAEELRLAAALALVACADVAKRLYATDASEERGAICSAALPSDLQAMVWKTADRKGGYARIASPARVLLKRGDPLGEDEEAESPEVPLLLLDGPCLPNESFSSSKKTASDESTLYHLCSPVAPVRVGPPASPTVLCACARTIGSGFRVAAVAFQVPPRSSPTRARLVPLFRKAIRLLAVGCSLQAVARPCSCVGGHKRVQGRYGTASALTPGLAYAIGSSLDAALRAKVSKLADADLRVDGLERIASSDLALSLDWRTEQSWPWKEQVHINILESSTIARLFLQLALEGGPLRFANLCDSNLARCAVVKGRSPSQGLRHSARRASAITLAAGLYHGGLFCPTRWIPADAPSRSKPLPEPVKNLGPG